MFTFAIWSRFSPSEFPNVWSAVSFCSYHASVLHGFSFLCLQYENCLAGLAGTIQEQIVDEEWRQPQQIEESYCFPAEITWRVNLSPNAQTRTHLIDSFGSLARRSAGKWFSDCCSHTRNRWQSFRHAELSVTIRISRSGSLPVCRRFTLNLSLSLPQAHLRQEMPS